jgi:hypothetical protein
MTGTPKVASRPAITIAGSGADEDRMKRRGAASMAAWRSGARISIA